MKQRLFFFFALGLSLNIFAQSKSSTATSILLDKELTELASYLPVRDSLKEAVSSVSVAWHIDHSLKVINSIINTLEKSDPNTFKPTINFMRGIVFITKKIPRGVAKASKAVTPPSVIKTEDILAQLEEVKQQLLIIDTLPKKANFDHTIFGSLNKKKSKKFLVIHTVHHLKIIRDILAN